MRALFITLSCIFAVVAGSVYAAGDAKEVKVSEVRKVEPFSSIEVVSVATIYFTQSDTYSLKIEGKERLVKNTATTVRRGCLIIDFKDEEKAKHVKEGVTIYLSAPDLKEMEFTGVGSFNCEKPLKLNDVKFQVAGVGKMNVEDLTCRSLDISLGGVGKADIHVVCDQLSASVDGVGRITLSGSARSADISKGGVGSVNTRNLKVGK